MFLKRRTFAIGSLAQARLFRSGQGWRASDSMTFGADTGFPERPTIVPSVTPDFLWTAKQLVG